MIKYPARRLWELCSETVSQAIAYRGEAAAYANDPIVVGRIELIHPVAPCAAYTSDTNDADV